LLISADSAFFYQIAFLKFVDSLKNFDYMNKIVLLIHSTIFLLLWSNSAFSADYNYTLTWLSPNTHTYVIEMEVSPEADTYTQFKIPAWRPGRYFLQDFAGGISNVSAKDGKGNSLSFEKTDKDTWKVSHGKVESVILTYHFFANNSPWNLTKLTLLA